MKRIGAGLCFFLLAADPSAAQAPRADMAAGYAVMRDQDRAETFPAGWVASVAGNINGWIGAAVEVGGSYRECRNCQRGPFTSATFRGTDRSLRVFTYMVGPRVSARALPRVTPFAQLLLGGSHISGGVQFDGALTTGFSYQPGAGIDVMVSPTLGLRVQGDYRVTRTEGHNSKASRLLAGLVWRAGRF